MRGIWSENDFARYNLKYYGESKLTSISNRYNGTLEIFHHPAPPPPAEGSTTDKSCYQQNAFYQLAMATLSLYSDKYLALVYCLNVLKREH
jgi:hypothetical protein